MTSNDDKIYISYNYPYTFSMLHHLLKELALSNESFYGESVLCKSLSGVDVPMVTITSRLSTDPSGYNLIDMKEFDDMDSKVSMPMYKRKKYIIITSRVHPGESNSSYMIQGLIKYLMGNSLQAV